MNFLDQPYNFTRTARECRSPAEYASAIQCPDRRRSPLLSAALVFAIFAAVLAAGVIAAGLRAPV